MTDLVYTGQNFTGIINSFSASSGQVVRANNFDCVVDQEGTTFLFGFITKYPKSTKVGNTVTASSSLGMHLFLPQVFSQTGEYKYLQGFTDGTLRYYDSGSNTWVSILSGYAANYPYDFETYSTRDLVYISNGIDAITKWRMGWTSAGVLKDKGVADTTPLTGDLTFTDGSAIITGAATAFTTELEVGDYIRKDSSEEYFEVYSISSDTILSLYNKYVGSTGAGGAGVSEKAIDANVNGRYIKIWKDRLIVIGGLTLYILLTEGGYFLLQEDSFELYL